MPPNTTNAPRARAIRATRIRGRVGRVNADAHDVASSDLVRVERLERFVNEIRCAEAGGRRRRQHIQPTAAITAVPNERSLG